MNLTEWRYYVTAEPKATHGYEPTDARHQFLAEMLEAKVS